MIAPNDPRTAIDLALCYLRDHGLFKPLLSQAEKELAELREDREKLNWIGLNLARPKNPIQIAHIGGQWVMMVLDPWWTALDPDKNGKAVYERVSYHDNLRDAVKFAMEQEVVLNTPTPGGSSDD